MLCSELARPELFSYTPGPRKIRASENQTPGADVSVGVVLRLRAKASCGSSFSSA